MFRKIVIFFFCVWCGHQILKKKMIFWRKKKIDKNQKSITARSDVCWDKGVYVKREGRLSFSRGMCIAGGWSGLYRTRWKMHRRDPSLSSLWLDLVRHPSFLHVTCLFSTHEMLMQAEGVEFEMQHTSNWGVRNSRVSCQQRKGPVNDDVWGEFSLDLEVKKSTPRVQKSVHGKLNVDGHCMRKTFQSRSASTVE